MITFIIFTFPALHQVIKLAKEHMYVRTVFKNLKDKEPERRRRDLNQQTRRR